MLEEVEGMIVIEKASKALNSFLLSGFQNDKIQKCVNISNHGTDH